MELEVMELAAEEVKLVECYRAMTANDKQLCLIMAARFCSSPAAPNLAPHVIITGNKNKPVIFNVGNNSNHSNNNSAVSLGDEQIKKPAEWREA